jgi:hypothetical protein
MSTARDRDPPAAPDPGRPASVDNPNPSSFIRDDEEKPGMTA